MLKITQAGKKPLKTGKNFSYRWTYELRGNLKKFEKK
jgi:hypothetical protein